MSNLWVTVDELDEYANHEYAYDAVKVASQLLWSMSGRKFNGVTTVTERYICASRAYRLGASSRNYTPELVGGDVYNLPFDEFDDYAEITTDGMSPSTRLRLRGRPIVKIHQIRDRTGRIVDPSNYYLVDHSTVQARAGFSWAPCNIEITYSYGAPAPAAGKAAARVLAKEFIKAWNGDDCDLPQRITSVTRQGVSYTILDSQEFIDDLRTGLYVVDLFLKSVNPDKARAKSRVFSPDVPRARRLVAKPLALGASPLDMYITGKEGGEVTINLDFINAAFLGSNNDWVPTLYISNYTGTKTVDLGSDAVSIDATNVDTIAAITNGMLQDGTATITTATAHGFLVGDLVTITGTNSTFDGSFYITDIVADNAFSFARENFADYPSESLTGTATVTNEVRDTITLTVGYGEAYAYVGFVDPGTWDLYASRPTEGNPSQLETVYIASGNLSLKLGSPVTPTYTLGG